MSVVIRVDADPRIGSGHFMRMVALTQMLRDDGREVHVAAAARTPLCDAFLDGEGVAVHAMPLDGPEPAARDITALASLARAVNARWVVFDGARFDERYQRTLREAGRRVLSVDDLARGHFVSDVVLNQNYGAERLTYSTEAHTRLLLGLRYVLLRREFRTAAPPVRRDGPRPLNVLITFGGTRQPALLARALAGVFAEGGVDARVRLILGASQDRDPALARVLDRAGARATVVAQTRDMPEAMAWADAAITAAGSTMWELIHMRVPFLVVPLDATQDEYAARLARDGLCARVPLSTVTQATGRGLEDGIADFIAHEAGRASLVERSRDLIGPGRTARELLRVLNE